MSDVWKVVVVRGWFFSRLFLLLLEHSTNKIFLKSILCLQVNTAYFFGIVKLFRVEYKLWSEVTSSFRSGWNNTNVYLQESIIFFSWKGAIDLICFLSVIYTHWLLLRSSMCDGDKPPNPRDVGQQNNRMQSMRLYYMRIGQLLLKRRVSPHLHIGVALGGTAFKRLYICSLGEAQRTLCNQWK